MIGDKKSWGKGFAKEASKEIINYCFKNLNLRKVNIGVLMPNRNALTLYESLGVISEKVLKNHKILRVECEMKLE